jgi:hypothetical protein
VAYEVLRYDAGMRAEAVEEEWRGWEAAPAPVRAAWRAPAAVPQALVVYRYLEGPGTLEGEAGRIFFAWLARMAWRTSLAESEGRVSESLSSHDSGKPLKTEVMFQYSADREREGGFRTGGT